MNRLFVFVAEKVVAKKNRLPFGHQPRQLL